MTYISVCYLHKATLHYVYGPFAFFLKLIKVSDLIHFHYMDKSVLYMLQKFSFYVPQTKESHNFATT